MKTLFFTAMLTLALTAAGLSQAKPKGKSPAKSGATIPAAGSKIRAQLMDALRAWTKEKHKLEPVFMVDSLLVKDGWALAQVNPQSRDGKNKYEPITALLREGEEGWRVTDVRQFDGDADSTEGWMADLQERYATLPPDILPLAGGAPAPAPAEPKASVPVKPVGGAAVTPGANDPVRKEIFDALRPEIADHLGLPPESLKFEAKKLLKSADWAWVEAVPQILGSKAKAQAIAALMMEDNDQWLIVELFTPDLLAGETRPATVERLARQYPELPTSLLK